MTLRKVEANGFASVRLTLTDGTPIVCICGGNGSNAENAAARDRLLEALQRTLALRELT